MADFTKRIISIILYWISAIELISAAHYCEWNVCTPQEDCCGPNICCPKLDQTNEIFYIVAWVLSGLLILAFCCALFKNRLCRLFCKEAEDRERLTPGYAA